MRLSRITSVATFAISTTLVFTSFAAITAFSFIQEPTMMKKLKTNFQSFFKQNANERIYIQSDKTYYKPNETVWLSAFVRNESNLKAADFSDIVHVELISPRGNVERHIKIIANNGVAKGDFDLKEALGGIYKIKAYTQYQKNDSSILMAEKEITVQSVVMPRLKMKLDFDKKAYGKGDIVKANLSFTNNENKPIANTPFDIQVAADGNPIISTKSTTDVEGNAVANFTLPKDLATTDVLANFKINFEGSVEAISRTVPVVLNQISLSFFPEGGDMIENVASKVAFRALNEFDKPADIEGFIFDENDKVITRFSSLHDGMGNFNFTPIANTVYHARITKPEGITAIYTLPDALRNGYALTVKEQTEKSIFLALYSFKVDTVSVIAQTRGSIQQSTTFAAQKGWNFYNFSTEKFPIGISQITLFDGKGIARAERLVFVNQAKQLSIKITADKPLYKPREKVTLNIRTLDTDGLPVSSDLALSVVDDNLLAFADDKQGNILAKMLLEPELKEKVTEPNFYFNKKEKNAAQALENLMLTAGWRRYTWKQVGDFTPSTLSYQAEQANINGVVYDSKGNIIEGATVTILPSKTTSKTDKKGAFISPKFDIGEKESLMEVTAPGYDIYSQAVYAYGSGYNVYLFKKGERPIYYRNRMVEKAGRAEAAIMMMDAMPMGVAKENIPDVAEENEMMLDMDDRIPAPMKKDVFENIPDEVIAPVEVGDLRDAAFKKMEEAPIVEQYYRAKEFPKRVYTKLDTTRADLATTLYWNGHVTTDQNGKATVDFIANDLISSFKATAEGFGTNGEVGRGETNFITNIPFSIDAKLPTQVTTGDQIYLPLFLKNNTDEAVSGNLTIKLPNMLDTKTSLSQSISVPAKQSRLVSILVTANDKIGKGELIISFKGKENDQLTRSIEVVAKGFPANVSLSAQELNKIFYINPSNVVKGSMRVNFTAFPNVMSELMKGIDAILREPYGCFEQTSSSNYPNVMALDYLRKMQISDPALEQKANKLIEEGYKKLVSFETKENGYEWFGAAPAHEALTAYGLMQFEDMKKVYPNVDQAMIERTRKLVLDKRDGKGGFIRNPRALDSFGGADEDVTNAYIVYALTESGYKELKTELDALYESAKKSKDPYIMALAANAFYNVADNKRGDEVMQWLYKEQSDFGYWNGKKHSITRSTGDALKIETSSLVALAIMKSTSPNQIAVQNVMKYLVGARNGFGSFGATQSTILALKALTRYAEFSKKTEESGTVEIYQNDKLIATKSYEKGMKGNLEIEELEKYITEGKQKIEVKFKGCKTALPYSMNVSYHTSQPQSAKDCVLDLKTEIKNSSSKVGETVRLSISLANKTTEGQPMSIAVIGIPAGLSLQPWQLKEMQEKRVFDFYEMVGNNVAFYYRSLAPKDVKTIQLDLKADIAGTYDAAASSAYLYYTNEIKIWQAGLKVSVAE